MSRLSLATTVVPRPERSRRRAPVQIRHEVPVEVAHGVRSLLLLAGHLEGCARTRRVSAVGHKG